MILPTFSKGVQQLCDSCAMGVSYPSERSRSGSIVGGGRRKRRGNQRDVVNGMATNPTMGKSSVCFITQRQQAEASEATAEMISRVFPRICQVLLVEMAVVDVFG